MIFSSNFLKRWSSQKGSRQNILALSGKMVLFYRKNIFFLGQEVRDDFSQEIHFLCTGTGVRNVVSRPSAKKIKDGLVPQKAT